VKGANILLTTSYNIPRDKLMMERARWYQASLKAMYIKDHPHVGRLIHPDHRRNLQTLLTVSVLRGHPGRWTCREQVEWYRFENSNFVRASSLLLRRLRHRLRPTTAATMPTPTQTVLNSANQEHSNACGGTLDGWASMQAEPPSTPPASSNSTPSAGTISWTVEPQNTWYERPLGSRDCVGHELLQIAKDKIHGPASDKLFDRQNSDAALPNLWDSPFIFECRFPASPLLHSGRS
jgi:hypothetical protein